MQKRFLLGLSIVFLVSISFTACGNGAISSQTATLQENTATQTQTETPTPLPPTSTFTISPSPTWGWEAAGEVTCPILLYHHIADINPPSLYYTSIKDFSDQMKLLHDLGYTAISISLLVEAITKGADIPPRPIVISFDDGDEDVYTNAFPVMKTYDFPGILFIVSNWLGSRNYLGVDEIKEMAAFGWEVGNHSTSHVNLKDNPELTFDQAAPSRTALKNALGLPIDVFAYPNGAANGFTMSKISSYGYKAAVGLEYPYNGKVYNQGPLNLFYLSRIEVPYDETIDQFILLLPWQNPIGN
jgi:peptidoglycan/xylan/chitin deacetylase (PgdA/CDA1 family)